MILDNWLNRKIRNVWLRCNLQYFMVGIIIGTFLIVLFQLFSHGSQSLSGRDVLTTYVVSIIITLCITNISLLSSRIIKIKFSTPIINILLNYLLISLGVIIGTEISYLFIHLVYGIPFSEYNQIVHLKFNLTIGLVAGTIIYLYQLQRDNYQLKIQDKELQLLKINELKTQADLKTLQARINPHFLYNALNSITSLIHEAPDKAEEMIIKLSRLFRYSINTQETNWATVKEELEIVNTYLDIERVRFENRISFISEADESVMGAMMPRFLLQPLVENALKHGLNNMSAGGKLKLTIKGVNQHLKINVYDNGSPFPSEMLVGYGLQSTIDKLNLLYHDSWKLEYVNSPEKKISLEFPIKLN